MRAVVITQTGPPEVLEVQERPDPRPAEGDVLIDVKAAGLNFADLMARTGVYPDAPKLPAVMGYEVAGTDPDGNRVIAATHFGGQCELVSVPPQNVVPLPEGWSFEQGAAFPVNYGTAYAALLRYGNLQPGERVLIHAAAGGVGIAATQIAKHAGAEVWGTASPSKHDAIRSFGVDHPLDYTRRGWQKGLPGLDLVMDAIGGASFRRSYKLLRAGGRLVCFGVSSLMSGEKRSLPAAARTIASTPWFTPLKMMGDSKAVIGLNILTLWNEFSTLEPWLAPLNAMIEDGAIEPVVAKSFPFDRAAHAHRHLTERRNVGKVVLTP